MQTKETIYRPKRPICRPKWPICWQKRPICWQKKRIHIEKRLSRMRTVFKTWCVRVKKRDLRTGQRDQHADKSDKYKHNRPMIRASFKTCLSKTVFWQKDTAYTLLQKDTAYTLPKDTAYTLPYILLSLLLRYCIYSTPYATAYTLLHILLSHLYIHMMILHIDTAYTLLYILLFLENFSIMTYSRDSRDSRDCGIYRMAALYGCIV